MPIKLNLIQAFAFDLDGTLVDSIADLTASANAMREQLNLPPLTTGRIKNYVGDGIGNLIHCALTDSVDKKTHQDLWEQGFNLFVRHYYQHLCDHTQAYPQVKTTLSLLKTQGYPLIVITNKNERFAKKILTELDLLDYFSLLIGGDTLPEKKPSILPLIHTCQVFQLKPQELALVGDSKNNIHAAKNAGCLSIGVSYGYEDVRDYQPDLVINQFFQLYDLLNPKQVKH